MYLEKGYAKRDIYGDVGKDVGKRLHQKRSRTEIKTGWSNSKFKKKSQISQICQSY